MVGKLHLREMNENVDIFTIENGVLTGVNENISGDVIIPDSVTQIGNRAFDRFRNHISVIIPNSVTKIGKFAFYLARLDSIKIPNSVTEMEMGVFEACHYLKSVAIPNSLTKIPERAFDDCKRLTSVKIPNSVTHIGKKAFFYCTSLTSVTIPNSVISIGDIAFACSSLLSVTIPNSVTEIGNSAFDGCELLTSITIPNSVTTIGSRAFSDCKSLTSIIIPEQFESELLNIGLDHSCKVNGKDWSPELVLPRKRSNRGLSDGIVNTYAVSYTDYDNGATLVIKQKGDKFAWECADIDEFTDFKFTSKTAAYNDAVNFLDPNHNSLYLDNQPVFDEGNYDEYNEDYEKVYMKLHLNEDVSKHFLLLEPDWDKQVYIVRDEANSIQEIKTLAQEWCDSDKFHIPSEYRKGHDIIYYGYCPETKKVYLPRWFTKADAEPFNYDWEIYGIEDYITEDIQSDDYYNTLNYYRSPEYAESGEWDVTLWNGYIDQPYICSCCGKKFPAGRNDVYLDGYEPDGMHFIYKLTKDNRVGNSINYDPYNLPPEDEEGGIFKVVLSNENDDEGYYWRNFCRNCWPKLTKYSPEELANKFKPNNR